MHKSRLLGALLLGSCLAYGCQPSESSNDEDSGPGQGDSTCSTLKARETPLAKLDLLFVIDNSGSMAEEQANLAEQLPRLVRALTTGDLQNGGSTNDIPAVSSLQLGVVSTDMGTDGAYAAGPFCQGLGDDGKLISQVTAASDPEACPAGVLGGKSYLSYDVDAAGSAEDAAEAFACVAALGIHGCGLEQQLEAMHKALSPSTVTDFVSGTGHADGANAGFLRDDAVLAVVHVTDEEDCSVTKEGRILFDNNSDDPRFKYDGEPAAIKGQMEAINFRCAYEATQADSANLLQPISRFVDGLLSLKASDPSRVVYAAITGVPPEAESLTIEGDDQVQDFDAILALDAMQVRPGKLGCTPAEMQDPVIAGKCDKPAVTGTTPPLPEPACSGPGGQASPARRIVQVASELSRRGLGHNALVRSICEDDFDSVSERLAQKIGVSLSTGCAE